MQNFKHPELGEIRGIEIDDEPWLVGKDVATTLGYKDTVNALKSHVDSEDKRGWKIATPGGLQEATIINESGLYSLIFSSKFLTPSRLKTGSLATCCQSCGKIIVQRKMTIIHQNCL